MGLFSKTTEQKKEQRVSEKPTKASGDTFLELPAVLVQPRISEKASAVAKLNKYIFIIRRKTNKVEVKKAVEAKYKVKVVGVNIINVKGKMRRFGRFSGKTADFKKAVVTLKEGDSIKGLTDVV